VGKGKIFQIDKSIKKYFANETISQKIFPKSSCNDILDFRFLNDMSELTCMVSMHFTLRNTLLVLKCREFGFFKDFCYL